MLFFEKKGLIRVVRIRFDDLINIILSSRQKIANYTDLSDKEKKKIYKKINKQLRRVLFHFRKYQWFPYKESEWHKDIYSEVFWSIKISRILWRKIKWLLKKVPGVSFVGRKIKKLLKKRHKAKIVFRFFLKTLGHVAVLLQSPLYGNVGDQAIAKAETDLFKELSVSYCDFPWTRSAEKRCAKVLSKKKVVFHY